ncbi:hypothetical protein As57867_018642, partial [Aphanomyces stellatus]
MDKYARIRVLGEGSFGQVYLMREKRNGGHLVCVKDVPLSPFDKHDDSLNEAHLMQKLRHPNIIEYHESILSRNHRHFFIVMAYCSGGTTAYATTFLRPPGDLHVKLRAKRQAVSESTACLWFVQICLGLHCMHAQHIMHRDVKSHNIFLSHDGHLVLGDLGIARELHGQDFATTFVGTPSFMSPEVFQGGAYSYASDVWSLGCVLYEICTLKYPFVGLSTAMLVQRVCAGDYTPLDRTFSPDLRRLVADMLSIDPARRPTLRDILARPFLRPAFECYVADVIKCGSKSHSDVLRSQLAHLRLATVFSTVQEKLQAKQPPAHAALVILPPNPHVPTHAYKAEEDMLAWLEKERQRHLLLVLERIKQARNDHLHQLHLPPAHSISPPLVVPESTSPRVPTPDPEWRPPVQSNPP